MAAGLDGGTAVGAAAGDRGARFARSPAAAARRRNRRWHDGARRAHPDLSRARDQVHGARTQCGARRGGRLGPQRGIDGETRRDGVKALVMKFGGTSVGDAACMRQVAQLVREALPRSPLVVLSAIAKVTDELFAITRV